eukprot:scaffold23502_cov117-Skeletonema_marinoi.AAC.6
MNPEAEVEATCFPERTHMTQTLSRNDLCGRKRYRMGWVICYFGIGQNQLGHSSAKKYDLLLCTKHALTMHSYTRAYLPSDIVNNNTLPFLELPSFTFTLEEED